MSLILKIADPSGKEDCDTCTKHSVCIMRHRLEELSFEMKQTNEDPSIHPSNTGWGELNVTCHGYQKEL